MKRRTPRTTTGLTAAARLGDEQPQAGATAQELLSRELEIAAILTDLNLD
ncbi:hypothetical protein [Sinomonas sp. G460-2]